MEFKERRVYRELRWSRYHTGFWHAYQLGRSSDPRRLRSACGVATSAAEELRLNPETDGRWQCRPCKMALNFEAHVEIPRRRQTESAAGAR